MSLRWLATTAALSLSACGGQVLFDDGGGGDGATSASSSASGATQACVDYCGAVVATLGCFTLDDCHERCQAFYEPSCASEMTAMLGCLPSWLNQGCQITYATDPPYGCQAEIDAAGWCVSRSSSCFLGAELVNRTGCVGSGRCDARDYEVRCDDDGRCSCQQDGEHVGDCAMPFTGVEPCTQDFSCCRRFFGY